MPQQKPSDLFLILSKECETGDLSVDSLIERLGTKSHALIILLFSVPFLTPIPVPGLSLLFGFIIFVSGLAIAFNQPMWLPKFIGKRKIKNGLLSKVLAGSAALIKKVEFIFKPRLQRITTNKVSSFFIGLIISVCGFLLLLPLPPGTNFPPALVTTVLSVGLLEKDGFVIAVGVSIFLAKILLILGLYSHLSSWISQV